MERRMINAKDAVCTELYSTLCKEILKKVFENSIAIESKLSCSHVS